MHETATKEKLAIEGGDPVRAEPLPLECPGLQQMDEEEVEAAARVLRSRTLFRYHGVCAPQEVTALEKEFAAFMRTGYAVAVASGTGALHTALAALGVGPGQEVILPPYFWVSVVAAVVNLGAIPVLADMDDTFTLNPAAVEAAITPRTAGVIMVHMSGAPGNVEPVQAIARKHNLFLLEDCAQCAGGSVHGRNVGTFGNMGIFSFQVNKNMTCGEGGCIVTDDRRLYRRAFACHDMGYPRSDEGQGDMVFDEPETQLWGRGCRLDELRAAIARVQLRKLPATIAAMRRSKQRIRRALEASPDVQLRKLVDPAGDTGCFLITTYRDAATARSVNRALRAEGILPWPRGASNIVMTDWGLHLYYHNTSLVKHTGADPLKSPWGLSENAGLARNYAKGACPYADSLFERSILMGIPSCLTERDEDDIIRAFQKVLGATL
jgi:dTDP-4-amino-4,6-dideoxygalactose transaminase